MALQNFVDKVGPVVSAAWLNSVDLLKFTIFGDSTTKTQARTALTSDNPLEVTNGGTGSRLGAQALYTVQTANEATAGVTPTNFFYAPLNVLRYGAVGDGVTNNTTAIQNAINVAAVTGASAGAVVYAPAGIYAGNWIIKSGVFIKGDGASTKFIPVVDGPVFSTPSAVATVRIGWEDCWIYGNLAFASQDGIFLSAVSGGFAVDIITLSRVRIENCGRYGLRCAGDALATAYIQRLYIEQCHFLKNANAGLSLTGFVFETTIINTFVVQNGGAAGAFNNCEANLNNGEISRLTWVGGGVNAIASVSLGIPQAALSLAHCRQVTLLGCDLESGDPFIKVSGNLTKNLSVIGCNLGTTFAATSFIQIDDLTGGRIDNCTFATSGGTVVNGILSASATSRVTKLLIGENNTFSTAITTPLNISNNLTIAAGVAFAYRNIMRLDTEAAAATDDLDSIYDQNGGTSIRDLIDGQKITLSPVNSSHDIVVKHGTGNILVNGAADFTLLTSSKFIILEWSNFLAKWFEVGRCA